MRALSRTHSGVKQPPGLRGGGIAAYQTHRPGLSAPEGEADERPRPLSAPRRRAGLAGGGGGVGVNAAFPQEYTAASRFVSSRDGARQPPARLRAAPAPPGAAATADCRRWRCARLTATRTAAMSSRGQEARAVRAHLAAKSRERGSEKTGARGLLGSVVPRSAASLRPCAMSEPSALGGFCYTALSGPGSSAGP